jgi:hypothetical protein
MAEHSSAQVADESPSGSPCLRASYRVPIDQDRDRCSKNEATLSKQVASDELESLLEVTHIHPDE